jgi:hypothetical protein
MTRRTPIPIISEKEELEAVQAALKKHEMLKFKLILEWKEEDWPSPETVSEIITEMENRRGIAAAELGNFRPLRDLARNRPLGPEAQAKLDAHQRGELKARKGSYHRYHGRLYDMALEVIPFVQHELRALTGQFVSKLKVVDLLVKLGELTNSDEYIDFMKSKGRPRRSDIRRYMGSVFFD